MRQSFEMDADMATATPERLDVSIDLGEPDGLYEVIDGRFVEKMMGAYECWLASVMFGVIDPYIKANPIGLSFRR